MTETYLPKTLEELAFFLPQLTKDSLVLAGGTDVIISMREQCIEPDCVLCLTQIQELKSIIINNKAVTIGTMVSMVELYHACNGIPDLQALADAAGQVGSPQIRNKATIGGNVCHASPAADILPVLWAFQAEVVILRTAGVIETIPIREFIIGAGKTQLHTGDVVLRFVIARKNCTNWVSAFVKLGSRQTVTIARISLTAIAQKENGTGIIKDITLVAGAIQPTPYELIEAEQILKGKIADIALASALGKTFIGHTRRTYKEYAAKGVFADLLTKLA